MSLPVLTGLWPSQQIPSEGINNIIIVFLHKHDLPKIDLDACMGVDMQ